MHSFIAENISIKVGSQQLILDLSFRINAGQVLTLMGPSGSGKSTLLSYIAGSLTKDGLSKDIVVTDILATGKLFLDNVRIDILPIIQRRVGILFQDDLLFSHMSVGENLLFAMTQKQSQKQRRGLIEQSLNNASLENFFDRMPATLSGGQRARVSVLRSLLARPKLILLDEPFSKLDSTLRESFRSFVFTEIKKQNIPCLLVTHDLADRPSESELIKLTLI